MQVDKSHNSHVAKDFLDVIKSTTATRNLERGRFIAAFRLSEMSRPTNRADPGRKAAARSTRTQLAQCIQQFHASSRRSKLSRFRNLIRFNASVDVTSM
jgi:hypothetical protein